MTRSEVFSIDHYRKYHNALFCQPKILLKHCLQFLLGVKMAPRETENKAYVKCLGDKQRVLWYFIVFSIVTDIFHLGPAFPFVS